MNKTTSLLVGAVVGTTVAFVANYIFGAASQTTYDAAYQSRWDKALAEGRAAAALHELEMRRQLEAAKRPQLTSTDG